MFFEPVYPVFLGSSVDCSRPKRGTKNEMAYTTHLSLQPRAATARRPRAPVSNGNSPPLNKVESLLPFSAVLLRFGLGSTLLLLVRGRIRV